MKSETLIKMIKAAIDKYAAENRYFKDFWRHLIVRSDFYIVGGAIRSIYKGLKPRDIDIIVKNDVEQTVEIFSSKAVVSRNYFGGYKLDFDGIVVDIWDFSNHWAFKDGILDADEKNLAESCFFDFDALVFSPVTNYLNINLFERSIRSRRIDFVRHDRKYIKSNPGELTNVARALVSAIKYNLSFSEDVGSYVRSYLQTSDFSDVRKCELRHYRTEQLPENEFRRTIQNFCQPADFNYLLST